MTRAKTSNNSTLPINRAKNVKTTLEKKPRWYEEYTDLMTFKKHPVHDVYLDRLALELLDWARSEENIGITGFLLKKGIPHQDYLRFVARSKNLALAHDEVKRYFGARREEGAIRKEFDAGMVYKSLPMYSPEWKENFEWQSNLKQKEVQEQKQTIVVLEKFPEKNNE
jgi:hypothetical protein